MSNNVCAIIVTFQPDLALLQQTIAATTPQVDAIVLVDNGSRVPAIVQYLNSLSKHETLKVVISSTNEGIAAAHNHGIREAKAEGYGDILLLDQDSVPAESMVADLLRAREEIQVTNTKIAAVGPLYIDAENGIPTKFINLHRFGIRRIPCNSNRPAEFYEAAYLISSGMLISLSTIESIGDMDAALFIDYVDIEWGLRARNNGFRCYGICSARLFHRLGDRTITIPILKRDIAVHTAKRHYYAVRNAILVYKRSYIPLTWKITDGSRLLLRFLFYTLFAKPHLAHFTMMIRGLFDGIRNRTGKY
jgi:rhamnosyltransferase